MDNVATLDHNFNVETKNITSKIEQDNMIDVTFVS